MSSLGLQQVGSEVTQSNSDTTNTEINIQRETQPRYPTRTRQPPNRLTY